jgi:uncharacterized membrane protein (DUF485 family)
VGFKLDVYGEDFLRALMRRQLRLSCTLAVVLLTVLGGLPLMNRFLPHVMSTRLVGLPISWWLLGVAVFPVLIAIGWVYVRWSNDFEDEAMGLVDVATLPERLRSVSHQNVKR